MPRMVGLGKSSKHKKAHTLVETSEDSSDDGGNNKKSAKNSKKSSRISQSQSQSQQASQQPSTSQCSQTQEPLSSTEFNRLSALCANYFMVSNCKKIPIKRADIGKLVPKEYSRKMGDIIKAASSKLEKVFGYKVVELEKKGTFMLVNLIDLREVFEGSLAFEFQPREAAVVVLRTSILTTILMSGGVISESILREYVKKFDLDMDSSENHPLLGNVQKLIFQDFVRQGYLTVEHHKDIELPFKDIRWGSRSKEELNKKELITFVCKVYGESFRPEMWIEQWRVANEEQNNSQSNRRNS